MIKIIYDCKLGTQNLFIKLNNEMNEVIFQEDAEEEEAELYAFLKEVSEEYKIEYIQDITSEMICDMLFDYFSQKVLRDTKFVEEADIFDIENIRIIKSKKTVRNMLEHSSLKASDVMNILHITRPTLCKYVKQGLVKIDSEVNGKYKYNRESVYALLNGKKEGETKMNLSEKLKLNYPKTTALEKVKNDYYARFDNNSSNSYNGIYEYCLAIKEKQDKGLVVKDEEYSLVPNGKGVCDNPYDGYYFVNFHYALHHPETILDKAMFEEQLKAFIEQTKKDQHKNYNMNTTLKWYYNSL